VPFLGIPEMRSQNSSVLEFVGAGELRSLYWSAMKFIQKINQFGPVPLQGCDILPFADRLGLKSDFAKPSAFMPVKEEKAVESSYGGLCFIDPIETSSTEENPIAS
jgi:hypothetical protein